MYEAGMKLDAARSHQPLNANANLSTLSPASQPSHHSFLASLPLLSREIKVFRRIRAYDEGIEKQKHKSIARSQQE
jgi:hypothetical protein